MDTTPAHQPFLSFTVSQSLFKLTSIDLGMPSTISSFAALFSFCLQSFPASESFQWVSASHQVAKVLELQLQCQSLWWIFRADFLSDWLVWSPYSPRDSQESSLTPQFKSINSLVPSLLYGPALTSIHDYWKNHSSDYTDPCWQSDVSDF